MNKNEVINALEDMKRQIEIEDWTVYGNDRGSGAAGVTWIDDTSVIDAYLHYAETGDNTDVPHCRDIYYIPIDDFDDEDKEVLDEILEYYGDVVEREEVLGFVVSEEHYDMPYTFYFLHIKG